MSDSLTDRQREIARLVAAGLSNDEIAACLCLVRGTVPNHIMVITRKLKLRNRVQLAVWVVKQGHY